VPSTTSSLFSSVSLRIQSSTVSSTLPIAPIDCRTLQLLFDLFDLALQTVDSR
jgi:hypothetical protein